MAPQDLWRRVKWWGGSSTVQDPSVSSVAVVEWWIVAAAAARWGMGRRKREGPRDRKTQIGRAEE
jgi:hypothetical protein